MSMTIMVNMTSMVNIYFVISHSVHSQHDIARLVDL